MSAALLISTIMNATMRKRKKMRRFSVKVLKPTKAIQILKTNLEKI